MTSTSRTMTLEQAACYIANGATECPFCSHTELDGNTYDFDAAGHEVSEVITCRGCHAEWRHVHTLSHIECGGGRHPWHPAPGASNEAWSVEDQAAADAEGWDLFTTDGCESEPWRDKVLMINRVDEQDRFESDEAALVHVIEQAAAGSLFHQRALQLHMTLRTE